MVSVDGYFTLLRRSRVAERRWCTGKRHEIRPGMPASKNLQKILSGLLSSISEALKVPACITEVELDLRSRFLRTDEVCGFAQLACITYILSRADGGRELVRGRLEACIRRGIIYEMWQRL
jgi:hypothetical protein